MVTLQKVKALHTAIFVILSACVLLVLFSGVTGYVTAWTWGAVAAIVAEGIALAASGGKCPLTVWAEKHGALEGGVADIFLPKWIADRIFPVCGSLFAASLALVAFRIFSR
jgi:hypothetical protein